MKRYSEYKDSGVKWIGEIPGHWKITTLKRHCKVNTGGTPSMSESRFYESPTISWFTPGDLSENLKLSDSTRKLSKTVIKEGVCKLFPINTVYFVGIGATVGKVGYSEHSAYCNQQINALIPYDINYKYLTYYLVFCKPEIVRIASASTLPIINQSKTGNIPLIELSHPEQEAIVTYLDTKVAKIDEYISIAEKKIAALEELKQTIIAEAVTRGIHKDVPMKYSGVKWIGMIPEHWTVCKMRKSIYEINIKNNPIKTTQILSLTNKQGVIPYEDKGNQGNKAKEDISSYKIAFKDNIIMNSMNVIIGSVGLSNYEGCVSPVYYVYGIREGTDKHFINYICQLSFFQKELRRFAKGILEIRLRVSSKDIQNTYIALPSLPEQQEIVTYLDSKVASINQFCQAERSQIEKLKEYKQRLISDVVTGKVKVTND